MRLHSLKMVVAMLAVLSLPGLVHGQEEFNQVLKIGDSAPVWKNLPGTDGNQHSLDDYAKQPVLVVIFTCQSCPIAVDYEGRLNALVEKYGSGDQVGIVMVCVNDVEKDKLPALQKRVEEKSLKFHYVVDESQQIGKDFGSQYTPEVYVFNKERKLVYMGALDDASDAKNVTRRYAEEAIDATLNGGTPEFSSRVPRGCKVRYARVRRKPAE